MIRFWAYHICASLFCIARSWAGYQAAPEAVGMSLAYVCRDEATMEWMLRAGSWKGTKVNVDFRGLIPSSATTPSFCGEIGMSAPYQRYNYAVTSETIFFCALLVVHHGKNRPH
jgi:hypothetical protein